MFTLILTITLAVNVTDIRSHTFNYDYKFRTETGCYLAGAIEARSLIGVDIVNELSDLITIEIECNDDPGLKYLD